MKTMSPGCCVGRRAPEVIEAHFVQRRRGGVAGQVAAVLGGHAVGLHHHRHRVPADVRLDAPLERAVARILRLAAGGNGVDVGGVRLERQVGAAAARVVDQPLQQEVRTLRAVRLAAPSRSTRAIPGFRRDRDLPASGVRSCGLLRSVPCDARTRSRLRARAYASARVHVRGNSRLDKRRNDPGFTRRWSSKLQPQAAFAMHRSSTRCCRARAHPPSCARAAAARRCQLRRRCS